MNKDASALVDNLRIRIAITPNWAMIECPSDGLSASYSGFNFGTTFHYHKDVDFSPIIDGRRLRDRSPGAEGRARVSFRPFALFPLLALTILSRRREEART